MTSVLSRCALAMVMAFALVLGGCEKTKVNEDTFSQIKAGMTLNQVENILGGSGEDETPPAGMSISGGGIGTQSAAPEKIYTWKSKTLKILVYVKDGKVVQAEKRPI
jgi:hypothetical protein